MPLYKQFNHSDSQVSIWKIEEDIEFFESKFSAHPDIQNESRKLQWFATRHLVNQMLGGNQVIGKDAGGKPFLKNGSGHISISHTQSLAAVILNNQKNVGVDLEAFNPRIERIAHKFLTENEITAIKPGEKIEKLILYWSAKEALYKLYGKGGIEFKTQLLIEPFELQKQGMLTANITGIPEPMKDLQVHYDFFDDHVISYVTGL
jgi:phosphopantetheine--protein transferase-like protein